jgi:P27 family predicted phage terminase small subunit
MKGNPGKRRLANEPKPKIAETVPEPPDFLQGYACDEWYRVAPQLHVLGLLTVVDVGPLAAYCYAFGQWKTAAETLTAMAGPDTSGALLMKRDGNPEANPLIAIARRAADDMVHVASHFGMAPAARARIASAGFEPPSGAGKFDGLIA